MKMETIKTFALAAGITAAVTFSAQAATVSVNDMPDIDSLKATSLSVPGGASFPGGAPYSATGDLAKVHKSPYGDSTTPFWFVAGKDNGGGFSPNSPVSMVLASVRTAFQILWGSPDSYNFLKFYLGGEEVLVLNGQDDINGGDPVNNGPTALVSVSGFKFDRVDFYSDGSNSFEWGNLAAVPVPAGGILLLTAMAGLAAVRRRKQA